MSVQPGSVVTSYAMGLPTGLVGTLKVRILADSDESVLIAPTTSHITEPVTGTYRADLTLPEDTAYGTYGLYWSRDGGTTWLRDEDTIVVTALDGGEIRPSLEDVANLLRQRTRSDATGDEIGTFNDDTRPTGQEVDSLIDTAVGLVSLRLGTRVPASAISTARMAIALRAAMLIELRLQATRTDEADSVYARLKELYDELMTDLLDSLADIGVAPTARITSLSTTSPTLAHLPDDWRIAEQGPYV